MSLNLHFLNLCVVLLPVWFIVILCFRFTCILLLIIFLGFFLFLFLWLFFLLLFLRRGVKVRTNRCNRSCLLFPHLIRPFLHLDIEVGIFTWGWLRVNQSEIIIREFCFYLSWIKTHSIAVLLSRHPLKNILLHLLPHFILHLPLHLLTLFDWQLDYL